MRESKEFMNEFMDKLYNDELEYEREPEIGEAFNPTPKEISEQVRSFHCLLKSGIIDDAIKVKIKK